MITTAPSNAQYNAMVAKRKMEPVTSNKVADGSPSSVSGNTGSNIDLSYMRQQVEEAKRGKARADQLSKTLRAELNEANRQLETVDKRINNALISQRKLQYEEGPFKSYSKLQRKTLQRVGLGTVSNKQSFGLAAITILLGITAIIGRVE